MPPVFAQPSPIPRSFSGGGGGSSAAGFANAIMDRQSQDADRFARMQLANAQMGQQWAMHQGDQALSRDRIQAQFALQDNAAANEMDQWMMKQKFTANDQQELSRQQNAVSELQDKLDRGEITEREFYGMLNQVAPRVNYLQAKEQHTRNKAMNEQREAIAAERKSAADYRDSLVAFQRAELEGKLNGYVPPRYTTRVSEIMQDAYPRLQPGSSEYEEMSKAVADERGWLERYAKKADGTVVYEKDVHSRGATEGGSKKSGGGDDPAFKAALEEAKLSGATEVSDALLTKHEKRLFDKSPEGRKQKAAEEAKTTSGVLAVRLDKVKEMTGLSEVDRRKLGAIVDEQRRLHDKYPPGERPREIQKRLNEIEEQFRNAEIMNEAIEATKAKMKKSGAPISPSQQEQSQAPQRPQESYANPSQYMAAQGREAAVKGMTAASTAVNEAMAPVFQQGLKAAMMGVENSPLRFLFE